MNTDTFLTKIECEVDELGHQVGEGPISTHQAALIEDLMRLSYMIHAMHEKHRKYLQKCNSREGW